MLRLVPIFAGLALAASAPAAEPARVLFLGDPVHGAIVNAAAKELKGEIQLKSSPVPANDSGTALARIDELLGDGKWDVIYFNFGIGDLFYHDPATEEIRVMSKHAGGVPVSSPAEYEQNLDQLAARLTDSGAKVIWGSTTPLMKVDFFASFTGNLIEADSEVEYNAIAAKVMKRHGIPVLDLHGYVMEQFPGDEKHPPLLQVCPRDGEKGQAPPRSGRPGLQGSAEVGKRQLTSMFNVRSSFRLVTPCHLLE